MIKSIINYFGYKTNNKEEQNHRNLLITFSLSTLCFSLLYFVGSCWINFLPGMISQFFTLLILMFICFSVKNNNLSDQVLGNLYMFGCYQTVMTICYCLNIYDSLVFTLSWLVFIPIIAMFVVNRISLYAWIVMCLLSLLVHINGEIIPNIKYDNRYETIFLITIFFALIILIFSLNALQENEKERKKSDLPVTNHQFFHQQKESLPNYNYTSRIQKALLPSLPKIKEINIPCFIFYQPKEIISGDFHWIKGIEEKQMLAVGDCTGHGVPGSFMSLIGNGMLNEIVNQGILCPSKILYELNRLLETALHRKTSLNADGMDIAFCIYDPNTQILEYSGARRPLIYVQEGELKRIKPNRLSVGGNFFREKIEHKSYKKHQIKIEEDTMIYLLSDGFQNQFDGSNTKKFSIKKVEELLLSISKEPLEIQKEKIIKELNEWKGNNTQTDDVLVVGYQIKI